MLVQLRLHVQKFFCSARDCIRTIFTERLPHVLAPRARRTHRLATAQQRIGLALGGAAGERLAAEIAHPAGTDTLLAEVRQAPIPAAPPSTKIGIDDWAKRKGQSYATIVVDLESGQPIDLLPERSAECVAQWLQEHPGVEIISRDRAGVYAEGARQGAPDAVQVADRWHLLKNLGEAVLQILQAHQTAIEAALAPPQPSGSAPAASSVATAQNQSVLNHLHQKWNHRHHHAHTRNASSAKRSGRHATIQSSNCISAGGACVQLPSTWTWNARRYANT